MPKNTKLTLRDVAKRRIAAGDSNAPDNPSRSLNTSPQYHRRPVASRYSKGIRTDEERSRDHRQFYNRERKKNPVGAYMREKAAAESRRRNG